MTLSDRIIDLAKLIGEAIKVLTTNQGSLPTLNTTAKTSLVDAINEVKASVGQSSGGSGTTTAHKTNYTQINTAYSVVDTDEVIVCNNPGAITITLPDANLFDKRVLVISRDMNSGGVLTLACVSMMQNNAGDYAASITQAVKGTWGSNCTYMSIAGQWKRLN